MKQQLIQKGYLIKILHHLRKLETFLCVLEQFRRRGYAQKSAKNCVKKPKLRQLLPTRSCRQQRENWGLGGRYYCWER